MDPTLEETIHRFSYSIKRTRYSDGSGFVIVYRYNDLQVPNTVKVTHTSGWLDRDLYDKLSAMLEDSERDEDFQRALEGLEAFRIVASI
jgi:hypothetical protein